MEKVQGAGAGAQGRAVKGGRADCTIAVQPDECAALRPTPSTPGPALPSPLPVGLHVGVVSSDSHTLVLGVSHSPLLPTSPHTVHSTPSPHVIIGHTCGSATHPPPSSLALTRTPGHLSTPSIPTPCTLPCPRLTSRHTCGSSTHPSPLGSLTQPCTPPPFPPPTTPTPFPSSYQQAYMWELTSSISLGLVGRGMYPLPPPHTVHTCHRP